LTSRGRLLVRLLAPGDEEAGLLFRLLARRYERASLILTSNKSFVDWGEIFNDQVLATAILDRSSSS
jgi:DNA replication protein DnaC